MLITGIHHKMRSEADTHRSRVFKRHLIHYLKIFAFVGIIFPVLIVIDYFLEPIAKEDTVTMKYIVPIRTSRIDYYIYTDSHGFRSDRLFFENTYVGNKVTFLRSSIFDVSTNVTNVNKGVVYVCELKNVYVWLLVVGVATFILSTMMLIKLWDKRKHAKNDSLINIGIINALLCIITIVAALFQKLY